MIPLAPRAAQTHMAKAWHLKLCFVLRHFSSVFQSNEIRMLNAQEPQMWASQYILEKPSAIRREKIPCEIFFNLFLGISIVPSFRLEESSSHFRPCVRNGTSSEWWGTNTASSLHFSWPSWVSCEVRREVSRKCSLYLLTPDTDHGVTLGRVIDRLWENWLLQW